MTGITGTKWAPGNGPNKTIGTWLRAIASKFSETKAYCDSVVHLEYFEWCGLTVAYCMAESGLKPVFGTKDTDRFLYALAWLDFGVAVQTPAPGDVVVFNFGGGDHHVSLFEADAGNGYWACRGGNQAHEVNLSNFPKSCVLGIRRTNSVARRSPALQMLAALETDRAVDDPSVPNKYPDYPVVPYEKTTMTASEVAANLAQSVADLNVRRAAYVLICNESASGKAGINNNYGGLQADAGRWSSKYDPLISATCVVTDSSRKRRRFLCFPDTVSCFQMITGLIEKRGLYVGGTTNFITHMNIASPSDWATAYYREWVTGEADAQIPARDLHSLVSMYQEATAVITA